MGLSVKDPLEALAGLVGAIEDGGEVEEERERHRHDVLHVAVEDVERGDDEPQPQDQHALDDQQHRQDEQRGTGLAAVPAEEDEQDGQAHEQRERFESVLTNTRIGIEAGLAHQVAVADEEPPAGATQALNHDHGRSPLKTNAG